MIFGQLAALRNWFSEYGHAYGGFGVSLSLAVAVGVRRLATRMRGSR